MAIAGWAAAGTPFRGDQALFAMTARDMQAGAVLYRDHWDITNPGIFWYYQLAGACFGFNEDGVHLFEWFHWLAFILVVGHATRHEHQGEWPVAPALFLGAVYYLTSCSDPSHLTKTEGLVGLPLFLAVWCPCRAAASPRMGAPWLIAAGVAGGVAILFKQLFCIDLLVCWLYLMVVYCRGQRPGWRAGLMFTGGIGLGMALPIGLAFWYFAAHDALPLALKTLFEYPPRLLAEGEHAGFARIAHSVRWFVEIYSPTLAVAIVGIGAQWRRRHDPFVVACVLLITASVAVILAQRLSWWTYHFLLLGVPASVLASYTWPAIVQAGTHVIRRPLTKRELAVVSVAGVAAFLPTLGHGANAYLRLARHGFGLTAAGRDAARNEAGTAYRVARAESEWLVDAKPGPIFVAGSPLIYWASGREPAVPISGWSMSQYPDELLGELTSQLKSARPVYIYVDRDPHRHEFTIRDRLPELQRWLDSDYQRVRESAYGVWYERKATPP